ncbi:MAG: putative phosphotransferase [Candidatus Saccharibacteria bacterium]|nr:putative phosphotransferase [Candidatus Saccharibacteria bacterium]
MTNIAPLSLSYDWNRDIAPQLGNIVSVDGGFTTATRGIVELRDGTKVFVKIADSELTEKWLKKEIIVYQKLTAARYPFIPELLACKDDHTGMAITYLDGANFENNWDKNKLDAVMDARSALQQYKDLFIGHASFKSDNIVSHDLKWAHLLQPGNLDILNGKLTTLGSPITFDTAQLHQFAEQQSGWRMREDTLIHEDIRGDNFGYNPATGRGMLIDWNWLCIGDESLDATSLFIDVYQSGLDPYSAYPGAFDRQMLMYLMSFWLDSILHGNEGANDREWRLRSAQARNMTICYELLQRP